MVRKNKEEYSTIGLSKEIIKKLKSYKIHRNQPIEEVINELINLNEKKKN